MNGAVRGSRSPTPSALLRLGSCRERTASRMGRPESARDPARVRTQDVTCRASRAAPDDRFIPRETFEIGFPMGSEGVSGWRGELSEIGPAISLLAVVLGSRCSV